MSDLSRIFILRGEQQVQTLNAFLAQNAGAMAGMGKPLEVRVTVHKAKASDAQRALIWVVLGQIAEQAWVGGRQFDADVWHLHTKRELLPERTAKGVEKWRVLPNDVRELAMSTEDLSREEKADYLDRLMAFAGSLGVTVEIEERMHA